jgi:Fic family protein
MTAEALDTSAIEGEELDPEATRSSVARQLGVDFGGTRPADRRSDGVVEMLVDASKNFAAPLTVERLCYWQAGLFRGSDAPWVGRMRTGADGPEQVVAGPFGRQRVLYEAPPGDRVVAETAALLAWFEASVGDDDAIVRSALAHLWFVTIHPFVDGNGRVARAVADLAFARADGSGYRYFSMSAQILAERDDYERALQSVQYRSTLDATDWLRWFCGCYERAIDRSMETIERSIERSRFWARHATFAFNERQRATLVRILGPWHGNLTTKKWAVLNDVSIDTATRDLQELVSVGILERRGAARSTHFALIAKVSRARDARAPRSKGTQR